MVTATNDSSHDGADDSCSDNTHDSANISCSDSTHDIYQGVGEILNANTFFKIHSTLRLHNDFAGVMECGRGCSSSRELSITDITVI